MTDQLKIWVQKHIRFRWDQIFLHSLTQLCHYVKNQQSTFSSMRLHDRVIPAWGHLDGLVGSCKLNSKFKIEPFITQIRKSTSSVCNAKVAGSQLPLDIATDLHRCRKLHTNSQPSPQNLESPGRGVDPTLQTKVITFSFYGDLNCGWGTVVTKKQKINKGRKKQRLELHIA